MPIIKTSHKIFGVIPSTKLIYFIHIPKCAGSSIEDFFTNNHIQLSFLDRSFCSNSNKFYWNRSSPQHISAEIFDNLFSDSFFDCVFTFSRHPIKRFISAYTFNHAAGRIKERWDINEFVSHLADNGIEPNFSDNHFLPMTHFISKKYNPQIFKLEKGFDEFISWFEKASGLHIPHRNIEKTNTSPMIGPKLKALSSRSIELIHHIYHEDFVRFGYQKDEG
jgi:hypothetical protein